MLCCSSGGPLGSPCSLSDAPKRPRAMFWGWLDFHPVQSSLESVSGADGRLGWLPGGSQITWINLGKRDAVSLFNRNVKYGRASQAWILDESAPEKWFKAGKPCEWSRRFSSHWTRCCNSEVLPISLQVCHLEFSRPIDQVDRVNICLLFLSVRQVNPGNLMHTSELLTGPKCLSPSFLWYKKWIYQCFILTWNFS